MNMALRLPGMTREQFFDWASADGGRYEFDGTRPVAMTGGSRNHNRIALALHRALFSRLQGGRWEALAQDAGLATVGNTVRYPDGLVAPMQAEGEARLISDVIVVFEVLSPSSGRSDRIVKIREYRAVASIRRYVILEYTSMGLTVLVREDGGDDWTATTLFADDTLSMPEIGIELPVAELYAGVDLSDVAADEPTDG
jgi:Uma2 family endonuclease